MGQQQQQQQGQGQGQQAAGQQQFGGKQEDLDRYEGGDGGEYDDADALEDSHEDRFRDMVSKDLDDNAYSVDKAHEILVKNFALPDVAEEMKAAVLEDWVQEAGIDV